MTENNIPSKGEIKEAVGAVTGDRRVEAEGRADKRVADPADPVDKVTDTVVESETNEVRQEHHDIPGA